MPEQTMRSRHQPTRQASWSGMLLFVCFFLPAMTYKTCNHVETLYPWQTVVLGFLYIPAALIAIIAFRKLGTSFGWLMVLRILLWAGLLGLTVGSVFLVAEDKGFFAGIFFLVSALIAALFLWAGGFLQRDEKYAARIGIALMVLGIPLFALMSWRHSAEEHGLIGAYLALAASLAFAHACFRWIRNPRLPEHMPPPKIAPTAVVIK
jgi:hypothetical protein